MPTQQLLHRAAVFSAGVAAGAFMRRRRTLAADQPIARFGIIADVQYADVEDAWNFRRTSVRRYRGALEALRWAVEDWQRGPPLEFIADLGDIIDQQCETNGDSHRALDLVLQAWRNAPAKIVHLIGNHELYNFNRAEMRKLIPNIFPWYRRLHLAPGWRVLILDGYELNMIEKDARQTVEQGIEYLSKHNPNDLRAPRGTVNYSEGLEGLEQRFVPMGGAMSQEQLEWIRQELAEAQRSGDLTIVLTHLPCDPGAANPVCLLCNFNELQDIFEDFKGTVPLVLAGHYHPGGYSYNSETQTHHVTIQSPLNAPVETPMAHGVVELFPDRILIQGRGIVPSRELPLALNS